MPVSHSDSRPLSLANSTGSVLIATHTDACDINVSPDKRTIFLHSENNLVQALKVRPCPSDLGTLSNSYLRPQTALEAAFSSARSTYDVTTQPSRTQAAQQSTQQTKCQGKPQAQTREREGGRGERESQHRSVSSASNGPTDRGRGSPCQHEDADGEGDKGSPLTGGVPHLLLGTGAGADGGSGSQSESEPEPEPTLVAQPVSTGKGGGSRARDGPKQGNGKTIDRPRSRAPSEPLFFPESDEERNDTTGRVDKGKGKESAQSRQNGGERALSPLAMRSATIATTSATPSSMSTAASTHLARSSTSGPDKPRSVQTVLSTRGAAWNLRKDNDADANTGRERKRARLSGEGERLQTKKKSFRSSLSQFLGSGSKALQDDEEEESENENQSGRDRDRGTRKEGDDSEDVDELDEESEGEERLDKPKKKRPRAGSDASQVTMVVPSDDEHAMDVDESPPTVSKHPRAATSSIPQTATEDVVDRAEDVEGPSGDDWAFSSTLVGTYVPPAGKTVEPSSSSRSTRPLVEADADSVTLRVNLINLGTHYLDMYNHFASSSESSPTPNLPPPSSTLRSAVSSANLESAVEDTVASAALSRIISKVDFEHMVVVGQFNLGFIIVRKRDGTPQSGGGTAMDDLFIVDQHAADEKWNFETLQEKTVIASQRLFRCVVLPRLTPGVCFDALCLMHGGLL